MAQPELQVNLDSQTINLTDLAKHLGSCGTQQLVSASGCASAARRLCDLIAMGAIQDDEEELRAATKAAGLFAMGAAEMVVFVRELRKFRDSQSEIASTEGPAIVEATEDQLQEECVDAVGLARNNRDEILVLKQRLARLEGWAWPPGVDRPI